MIASVIGIPVSVVYHRDPSGALLFLVNINNLDVNIGGMINTFTDDMNIVSLLIVRRAVKTQGYGRLGRAVEFNPDNTEQ